MTQQKTPQAARHVDQQRNPGAVSERGGQTEMRPVEDLVQYVCDYTRERPETVAIACFAVGFILGWRLKPW
jgi:hypothetical protein